MAFQESMDMAGFGASRSERSEPSSLGAIKEGAINVANRIFRSVETWISGSQESDVSLEFAAPTPRGGLADAGFVNFGSIGRTTGATSAPSAPSADAESSMLRQPTPLQVDGGLRLAGAPRGLQFRHPTEAPGAALTAHRPVQLEAFKGLPLLGPLDQVLAKYVQDRTGSSEGMHVFNFNAKERLDFEAKIGRDLARLARTSRPRRSSVFDGVTAPKPAVDVWSDPPRGFSLGGVVAPPELPAATKRRKVTPRREDSDELLEVAESAAPIESDVEVVEPTKSLKAPVASKAAPKGRKALGADVVEVGDEITKALVGRKTRNQRDPKAWEEEEVKDDDVIPVASGFTAASASGKSPFGSVAEGAGFKGPGVSGLFDVKATPAASSFPLEMGKATGANLFGSDPGTGLFGAAFGSSGVSNASPSAGSIFGAASGNLFSDNASSAGSLFGSELIQEEKSSKKRKASTAPAAFPPVPAFPPQPLFGTSVEIPDSTDSLGSGSIFGTGASNSSGNIFGAATSSGSIFEGSDAGNLFAGEEPAKSTKPAIKAAPKPKAEVVKVQVPEAIPEVEVQEPEEVTKVTSDKDFWRVQIEAIYRRRNQHKLGDVPGMMEKHEGKEVLLYKKVCQRYDLDSSKFYADPKAWDSEDKDVKDDDDDVVTSAAPSTGLGFSGAASTSGSLFGASSGANLFGKEASGSLLFDIPPAPTDPDKKINIFASGTEAEKRFAVGSSSAGLFGSETASGGLFGMASQEGGKNLFGDSGSSGGSLFASSAGKPVVPEPETESKVVPEMPATEVVEAPSATTEAEEEKKEVTKVTTMEGFWQVQIEAIYRRRNPHKLKDVPGMMEKHKGKESLLYRKVCQRYDLDSKKLYADPKSWDSEDKDIKDDDDDGASGGPFSGISASVAASTPANLFGSSGGALFGKESAGGSIFDAPAEDKKINIFATAAEKPSADGGLFGSDSTKGGLFAPTGTLSGNLFGDTSASSGGLFDLPGGVGGDSQEKTTKKRKAEKPAFPPTFPPQPLLGVEANDTDAKDAPGVSIFGSSSSASSIFGTGAASGASTGSLFGAGGVATASPLFGGADAASTGSVFGGSSGSGSIFAFGAGASSPSTGSIFCGGAASSSGSVFGGAEGAGSDKTSMFASSKSSGGNIFGFGGSDAASSGSLFGGSSSSSGNIFGFGGGSDAASSGSLFGGSSSSSGNIFGFGGGSDAAGSGSMFGGSSSGSSGNIFAFGAGGSAPAPNKKKRRAE